MQYVLYTYVCSNKMFLKLFFVGEKNAKTIWPETFELSIVKRSVLELIFSTFQVNYI